MRGMSTMILKRLASINAGIFFSLLDEKAVQILLNYIITVAATKYVFTQTNNNKSLEVKWMP